MTRNGLVFVLIFLFAGIFLINFGVANSNLIIDSDNLMAEGQDVSDIISGVYVFHSDDHSGYYVNGDGAYIYPRYGSEWGLSGWGISLPSAVNPWDFSWMLNNPDSSLGIYEPVNGVDVLGNVVVLEDCDLSNSFRDVSTGECVCDFGRGYVSYADSCRLDFNSQASGGTKGVSSCGVMDFRGTYALLRDIDVSSDSYFQENGVCFTIVKDSIDFNLKGYDLINTNTLNLNSHDLVGIAVSGQGIGILGADPAHSPGAIGGFSGAGIYIYSAAIGSLNNLNISNNRIGIYFGKRSTMSQSYRIDTVFGFGNDYGLVVNFPESLRNSEIKLINFGMSNYTKVSSSQVFKKISTCQELQNVNNDLSANYQLINNIDCSDTTNWNNGQGFIPIGTDGVSYSSPFQGVLDGRGFSIDGLYISTNAGVSQYSGFIAASLGNISNLKINNANIYLGSGAGARFGSVGGLVGYNYGSISNCFFSGNVSSLGNLGGLVGMNHVGTIENSYSSGNVNFRGGGSTSQQNQGVGGLVGVNYNTVSNSYSLSNVNANVPVGYYKVGGLVGKNIDSGNVSNSYAAGNVFSGGYTAAGCFLGNGSLESISNSFCNSTSNLESVSTFSDWDSNIWNLREGYYPRLVWQDVSPGFVSDFEDIYTGVEGDFGGILINNVMLTVDKSSVFFPDKIYFSNTSKLKVYDSGNDHGSNDSIIFDFNGRRSLSIDGARAISLLDAIVIRYKSGILTFDANTELYPELNVLYSINSYSIFFPTLEIAVNQLFRVFKNRDYFTLNSHASPLSFNVKGFELCTNNLDCVAYGKSVCVDYSCEVLI